MGTLEKRWNERLPSEQPSIISGSSLKTLLVDLIRLVLDLAYWQRYFPDAEGNCAMKARRAETIL